MFLIKNTESCSAKGNYYTPIHISSTSGSTGIPFNVVQDFKKRNRTIADLKVFGEMCEYPSHERMIFFRVISTKLHRTKEQEEKDNIYYIDCSDLGDMHLEEMKQIILEKEPRTILGYSSVLIELAKYIKRTGIPHEGFSMKSILTGGEGLSDEDRHLLESVFGCTVYRRYSDMEMGILGQDTGGGSAYVLNWGSYYFECLKMDSDKPAESGEVGRIVVTDLFNYAFPMIRYDTGDTGILSKGNGISKGWPYISKLYGRRLDLIFDTSGNPVQPMALARVLKNLKGIIQWQFVQTAEREYKIRLNMEKEISVDACINELLEILGKDAIIAVDLVDEIPVLASGKRKPVVNEWNK